MHFDGLTVTVRDGLAYVVLDRPDGRVNILSSSVMLSLEKAIEWMHEQSRQLKACIISSVREDSFIVGADLDEIAGIKDSEIGRQAASRGQAIFNRLESLPFPVVCVIGGSCMGGGTELALACHYRLATDHPKTRIALPEVMLGIIPGFGGTQRLPRLIGLQRALPLILGGKPLDPQRALKNAVVDKIVPWTFAIRHAEAFVEEILSGRRPYYVARRRVRGLAHRLLESAGNGLIFRAAKRQVLRETKGFYPAPLAGLKSVCEGFRGPLREGLQIEAKYLGDMIVTPISKNLIRIFRWTESIKKSRGTDHPVLPSDDVRYTGIIGAGVMGGGIAQLFASCDRDVRIKDISHEALALGLHSAAEVFNRQVRRRRMSRREVARKMGRITATLDYSGFRRCDLVVEAVVENMDIKKQVIRDAGSHMKEQAVFASNTSSLSITDMAAAYQRPEMFVGMHFFNPVHRMPLVEIIRGRQTADVAVATVFDFAKKLGKTPIVVNDGPGFLVNRLLMPYLNEAGFLLDEGVPIGTLDRTMTAFGMPMGPCLLLDEIGIDVAFKVGKIFESAFTGRLHGSQAVEKLYASKRLGKKGRYGFYDHTGKRPIVDHRVESMIAPAGRPAYRSEELVERLVYPMINEAAMCLAEGIVRSPEDVDIGMIFGTGFPPFRGGLLRYADDETAEKVIRRLEELTSRHGSRFEPCTYLKDLQKSGKTFHHYN